MTTQSRQLAAADFDVGLDAAMQGDPRLLYRWRDAYLALIAAECVMVERGSLLTVAHEGHVVTVANNGPHNPLAVRISVVPVHGHPEQPVERYPADLVLLRAIYMGRVLLRPTWPREEAGWLLHPYAPLVYVHDGAGWWCWWYSDSDMPEDPQGWTLDEEGADPKDLAWPPLAIAELTPQAAELLHEFAILYAAGVRGPT